MTVIPSNLSSDDHGSPKTWSEWLANGNDELYRESRQNKTWSILLLFAGYTFFILRRLNVYEHIKHRVPALNPYRHTPAAATDAYILLSSSEPQRGSWVDS